jgi:hypothetical protein
MNIITSEKIVDTFSGNQCKYEIVEKSTLFRSEFYVKKDGEVISYNFSSLKEAMEWAKGK